MLLNGQHSPWQGKGLPRQSLSGFGCSLYFTWKRIQLYWYVLCRDCWSSDQRTGLGPFHSSVSMQPLASSELSLCSELRMDSGRFLLNFRKTDCCFYGPASSSIMFLHVAVSVHPCAWVCHRQLDKAVTLQVVRVIKCHAQSILKSRRGHQNGLQLYEIIIKN